VTTIDVKKRAQVRSAYTKGMPVKQITEKFDICKSTLYNWLKPGTKRSRPPKKYGKEVRDQIATLNYRGYSDLRIARTLGLGKTQVAEVRKAMGLPAVQKKDRV
jgi:transposase-like protein